jgi:anti-anti-sigma regulatory factor
MSVHRMKPRTDPSTIVVVLGGRLSRADIVGLCERVATWIGRSEASVVVCDVTAVVDPDAVTIDALARLQLTARRLGRQLRIRHTSTELQELLIFTGLNEVIPLCAKLAIEARGQAEQGEQTRRVEEEGDPYDLTL